MSVSGGRMRHFPHDGSPHWTHFTSGPLFFLFTEDLLELSCASRSSFSGFSTLSHQKQFTFVDSLLIRPLYCFVSAKSCLLCIGERKSASTTPRTPTPFAFASI